MYLHGDTFGTSFYSNHYECNMVVSSEILDNFTLRFPSVFHPKDYEQFEHLLTIPAKENRVILYDGWIYHRPAYQDYSGKEDRIIQNFWFKRHHD